MTSTKQSQKHRLLAYLRKNRKGITSLEAADKLRITNLHKRIGELEAEVPCGTELDPIYGRVYVYKEGHTITRKWVKPPNGNRHVRYSLAR